MVSTYGRVEVCYQGNWGTICDDDWDITDATVVCKELGFSQALAAPHGSYYGAGSDAVAILMDNVQCSGTEATLIDCPFKGWGINDCSHDDDAGVLCGGNKLYRFIVYSQAFSLFFTNRYILYPVGSTGMYMQ